MKQPFPWTSSLKFKLGGSTMLLLILLIALVVSNLYALSAFKSDLEAITYTGKNRTAYPILYGLGRLSSPDPGVTLRAKDELRRLVAETDRWSAFVAQTNQEGDSVSAATMAGNVEKREHLWEAEIKPLLEQVIVAPPGADLRRAQERLDPLLRQFAIQVDAGLDLREGIESAELERQQWLQLLFSIILLTLLLFVLWLSLRVVKRTGALVATAGRIRQGELDQSAPVEGRDELAALGAEFNEMTAKLRNTIEIERAGRAQLEELLAAINETTNSLSSASAEILAGTTQQAAGMREQSSAVAETVTTVDEVLQTSEQAAERANAVSESSQRAADVSVKGRKAIDDTVQSITRVQEHSGSITDEILRLAEHGQEIGEIIAAVTDIADQTNLLAVNASIEASRAGEHGKGFTVVAQEIKDLADQSKKATAQVRQILGEVQKSTHAAVMAAEAGTRSVEAALDTVNDGGATIRILEETITDAARAATQIAASAAQQATGMTQIQQAMTHINEATTQNLAATRQTEQAAQDLNELGTRLKGLLAGNGR